MTREKTFLTKDEIKDILRQPNRQDLQGKRDYCILRFLILTGLRRSEICSLRFSNLRIDGTDVSLIVRGKGDKIREIPLEDLDFLESLQNYWNKANIAKTPDTPLFLTSGKHGKDKPHAITPRVIIDVVKKYAKLAKIERRISPHSLRHTFATWSLKDGGDLVAVQALMGHSSVRQTSTYLHTDAERKRAVIKKLTF